MGPGTGSGGGGGTIGIYGGANGGSSVVVVRYKIAELAASAKATGGLISFYNNKTIHTFLASGTFTVTDSTLTSIETVIVAGGGGGGGTKSTGSYTGAGGGESGGVYVNNSMTVSSTGGPQSDGLILLPLVLVVKEGMKIIPLVTMQVWSKWWTINI